MISDSEIKQYFTSQVGRGIDVYSVPIVLRGRGIGGIPNNVIKLASPILLKVLHSLAPVAKHVGNAAVKEIGTAGLQTLGAVAAAKPAKGTVQRQGRMVGKRMAQHITAGINKRQKRDILS